MLSEIKTDYDSIIGRFAFKSSELNKQILLEMAKNGESKPNWKTKLGIVLRSYTDKLHNSYDPDFDKKIRKLRPDWFIGVSHTSNIKKQILLEMAKNGESKPSLKTKIGRVLRNYTKKSSTSYDPDFDKKIRKLRPDWFIGVSHTSNTNKQILLEMAKNGEFKPSRSTKIGRALSHYTDKSHASYDPDFDKKIRKLRPDWFLGKSHTSNVNKQILFEMAKNRKSRPSQKTKIGRALSYYTNKSSASYDPDFDKKIRSLRPDWFLGISHTSNTNKQILLEMAKNGKSRPSQKTKIGRALSHYTNKSSESYDPDFDKKIRKLRPDWF